jgi:hypothetical protein
MDADEVLAKIKADPNRVPRLINVTVRVDDFVFLNAIGQAMREGKSINGLIADLLSEYTGIPTRAVYRRQVRSTRPRAMYDQAVREEERWRNGGQLKPRAGGGRRGSQER